MRCAGREAWAQLAADAELVSGDVGLVNRDRACWSSKARGGFGPLRRGLELGGRGRGRGVVAGELGARRKRVTRVLRMAGMS